MIRAIIFSVMCLATTNITAQTRLNNSITVEDVDNISSACDLLDAWTIVFEEMFGIVSEITSVGTDALEMDRELLQQNEERFKIKRERLEAQMKKMQMVDNRLEEKLGELGASKEDMENCHNYDYLKSMLEDRPRIIEKLEEVNQDLKAKGITIFD